LCRTALFRDLKERGYINDYCRTDAGSAEG
jgi:hypothetical protein